jgi:AbrB family looped-hinge helix DNA binding protein
MITSKLTSKAQTTIPAPVRTALRLKAGDELVYSVEGDRVILTKGDRGPGDDPFVTFDEWSSEPISGLMANFEPWDIVRVPFPYTDRPVRQRRPALVIAAGDLQTAYGLLWLAMITSEAHRDWPGDVVISDLGGAGLPGSVDCSASEDRDYRRQRCRAARNSATNRMGGSPHLPATAALQSRLSWPISAGARLRLTIPREASPPCIGDASPMPNDQSSQ